MLQSTVKVKLFLLQDSEHAMLAFFITWFEVYLELTVAIWKPKEYSTLPWKKNKNSFFIFKDL